MAVGAGSPSTAWRSGSTSGRRRGSTATDSVTPTGSSARSAAAWPNRRRSTTSRSTCSCGPVLVGLLLCGAALALTCRDGIRAWRRHPDGTIAALAFAAVAVLVGLCSKALFESILEKGKLAVLIGLCAGAIAAAVRSLPPTLARARDTRSADTVPPRRDHHMDMTTFGRALRRFWPLSFAVFVADRGRRLDRRDLRRTVVLVDGDAVGVPEPGRGERRRAGRLRDPGDRRAAGLALARAPSCASSSATGDGWVRLADRERATSTVASSGSRPRVRTPMLSPTWPTRPLAASSRTTDRRDTDPVTPATKGDLVVVEVIDTGAPDTGSGRDNLVPIMLATAVLGAILAGAAAVARPEAQPGARPRGSHPHRDRGPGAGRHSGDAGAEHRRAGGRASCCGAGPAPLIEAFQTLRSRIEVLLPDDEAAVAISSWQRKEGRTTVTAGLGVMLSAVGERVRRRRRQPAQARPERPARPARDAGAGRVRRARQR